MVEDRSVVAPLRSFLDVDIDVVEFHEAHAHGVLEQTLRRHLETSRTQAQEVRPVEASWVGHSESPDLERPRGQTDAHLVNGGGNTEGVFRSPLDRCFGKAVEIVDGRPHGTQNEDDDDRKQLDDDLQ